MNWPPTTMATQHPDNACAPWWKNDENAFVSTKDEIDELITLFTVLPIDEYMWDWEGKYVDEAVAEKVFSQAQDLLKEKPLGTDLHLTYRIPSYEEGKLHRSARAFMNMLSASDFARDIGMQGPPMKEMFLPLTVSADQLLKVRSAFLQVAEFHSAIFHGGERKHASLTQALQVTPLIEDTDSLFHVERILQPYWEVLKQEKHDLAETGQRVFFARSDPALNAGLVPAVLSVKVALSASIRLGEEMGFPVYPIIGTGSLPFRGSVNPQYVEPFLEQYAGVRTYSIQSAFRYDFPRSDVETALRTLKEEVPKREVQYVPDDDRKQLLAIADIFTQEWKATVEPLAPLINRVAAFVPSRRERLQHIGLFGYSREVSGVRLPRAIKFTASLYSVGVPPELIGTGRGLRKAREQGLLPLIDTYYPALRQDLQHAGKYVNRENIELAAASDAVFKDIQEDLRAIDDYLGTELGPQKPRHTMHRNCTSTIYHRLQEDNVDESAVQYDIVEAGKLRRSLG